MTRYCYLNGKIMPEDKAGVSVRDMAVLRGYGMFEFLRTYDGRLFHFEDHIRRFRNSARMMGLRVPLSDKEIKSVLERLIVRNKFKEAALRLVLSGGRTVDGMRYDWLEPTFFILADEFKPLPVAFYKKGAAVVTHEYQREMPEAKTTNYLAAAREHNIGKNKNGRALEILYVKNGKALECTTSNFFIFKGDTLITPEKDVLKGVTRKIVLKLARPKFKIKEGDIKTSELKEATEAFLTATNKEIAPIVRIDGQKIGSGKVGRNTKILMDAFRQSV